MFKILKFLVIMYLLVFILVPFLIGLAIRNAYSAGMSEQELGSISAVNEARTMKVINKYCHYVSQSEVVKIVEFNETFAKDVMKKYPDMVGIDTMAHRQKIGFEHSSKAQIKKSCADPLLKKYFMGMYNSYAANEGD